MTKVLIADKLSPAAVDIFKARGIETDIKVGLSKDELIEIIPQYDGLAVRSACKPNADVIAAAKNLNGRRRHRGLSGATQMDLKALVLVFNLEFGQLAAVHEPHKLP